MPRLTPTPRLTPRDDDDDDDERAKAPGRWTACAETTLAEAEVAMHTHAM